MPEISRLVAVVTADTKDAEKGLGRVESSIGGLAKGASLAFAGVAAGIAVGAGAAVKAAATFEQTMAGVKAVSGATNTEMEQLSQLALKLGKDTSFSASQAAAGIEELVKGGLSVGDIMGGAAQATLNLAAAGGVDLPEAATIAANALAQFNLKGSDMAHVADLIAGAANASALDVGQFKFSLQAAGAVAATTGFSFDDLAQAIAVMGKAGITGSDAGTSLKTMMMNLQPQTKAARAEMRDLGLYTDAAGSAFFDAQGKVKSMAEVAGLLQNATKNLTEEQRLQALQTIFGSDAIRAAAVLAKEGASGFADMAAAMGKVTAESVAAERLNNLNGDLEQLKGSLETLAIAIGTAILPALRDLVQWATNLINAFIPLAQQWAPKIVQGIKDIGETIHAIWVNGEPTKLTKALQDWLGVDLTPLITRIYGVAESIRTIQALLEKGDIKGAFLAAFGEFEPTFTRIGRAADTVGTAINTILIPSIRALADTFTALTGATQGTMSVMDGIALSINSRTAEIEKLVDQVGALARKLYEAQQAWSHLFDFARANPLSSGVVNAIPGVTTPAPAGPLPGGVTAVRRRDAGGPVRAGEAYQIGQGPYREYFIPGQAGTVQPVGGGPTTVTVPVYIGGEQLATVVARANERYAARGGYIPRSSLPPPVPRGS